MCFRERAKRPTGPGLLASQPARTTCLLLIEASNEERNDHRVAVFDQSNYNSLTSSEDLNAQGLLPDNRVQTSLATIGQ
jgi:hypothetical protein